MKKKPSVNFFNAYTKSQQKGIIVLLVILVSVVIYNYVHFNLSLSAVVDSPFNAKSDLVIRVTNQIDSIKAAREEARKTKPNSIKLNFISEYNAYKVGFTAEEFDKIRTFNQSGNWFNSKEDLALLLQKDTERLDSINQFLIYPSFSNKNSLFNEKSATSNKIIYKKDLNLASAEDLQKINGVGEVISQRIITYRVKMGGFRDELQLKEIYGINRETYTKLVEAFEVRNKINFTKLDLKSASVVELAEIPYFNYELSREIKRFVDLRQGEVTFDDLLKINDFPTHKLEGIKLYLEIID